MKTATKKAPRAIRRPTATPRKLAGGSIKSHAREVAADPARARKVLQSAGILTRTGRLAKAYK